ncbi:DUF389 domain-containing protein [Eubacteriaceae bacterium ES3]|nr:DUF389 domain-containing protein [Eubacteriaceae bacterium ES3]
MKEYFLNLFNSLIDNLNDDQLTTEEIHASIVSGIRLNGAPLIILFCAIIVASVGLNVNSTAVIIGAMLISPLMNPIITIGYSAAIYDGFLLRDAFVKFGLQVIIALIASSIYFLFSPLDTATSELVARTSPSFFDMLIAFFGGAAGIIGSTRREKSNVIPGVAIATALMPPMCTVGYGIANQKIDFILGAGYLFTINAFFIILATFLIVKIMKLRPELSVYKNYNIFIKRIIIVGIILIALPATITTLYTAYNTFQNTVVTTVVENYINTEVDSSTTTTIRAIINRSNKTLEIDLMGDPYTDEELASIISQKDDYGLEDYTVSISQDIRDILYRYFSKINDDGVSKNIITIEN